MRSFLADEARGHKNNDVGLMKFVRTNKYTAVSDVVNIRTDMKSFIVEDKYWYLLH